MKTMRWVLAAVLGMSMAFSASAAKKVEVDSGDGGGPGAGAPVVDLGTGMTQTDQMACEFKMCAMNPGGPTEFQECQPSYQWAQRRIAKGKPIPPCKFLSQNGGGTGGGSGGSGGGNRGDHANQQIK